MGCNHFDIGWQWLTAAAHYQKWLLKTKVSDIQELGAKHMQGGGLHPVVSHKSVCGNQELRQLELWNLAKLEVLLVVRGKVSTKSIIFDSACSKRTCQANPYSYYQKYAWHSFFNTLNLWIFSLYSTKWSPKNNHWPNYICGLLFV